MATKHSKRPLNPSELPPPSEETRRWEEEQRKQEAAQAKAKRAAGRHTLEEAAAAIEAATGERAGAVLAKLINAVQRGELPAFEPGKHSRMEYGGPGGASHVLAWHEEVYGEDVSAWLARHEPRLQFRFPGANEPRDEPPATDNDRQDILWPAINKARAAAAPDTSAAAVYAQLRELALAGEPPFTGEAKGALAYTNARDQVEWFTQDALRKRLRRLPAANR